MINLINFLEEYTEGDVVYKNYILYSGRDINKIKSEIVDDIKDEWEDEFEEIADIYSNFSLDDISYDTNDIINDYIKKGKAKINNYKLTLSEPYTDLRTAIDFYFEYLYTEKDDLMINDPNNTTDHIKFIFAGYYLDVSELIGIIYSRVLEYLTNFKKDYKVSFSEDYINKVTKILSY